MRMSWRTLIPVLGLAVAAGAADARGLRTSAGPVEVATVAAGLRQPWAMEFLPDGRMLVTERPGNLRLVSRDGTVSRPLAGVPPVRASGQGGLLDVALAGDFADSGVIFLAYAEAGDGGAGTTVARARLAGVSLEDVTVIFRQEPKVSGGNHFGSRIVPMPDGTLFVTTGDRFKFDPAQDLAGHIGKLIRIGADGSVPADNPFVGRGGARPEIWSYGHRNMQGAAVNPATGSLWIHEHGPRGGDEVNVPAAGQNYGWPLVSFGDHYSGQDIASPMTRPDLAASIHQWTPSIAPSGLDFYRGDLFPAWRGDALVGALRGQLLVRLDVDGDRVTGEERIDVGERIRDVKVGPDGAIYLVTDGGDASILRLAPAP